MGKKVTILPAHILFYRRKTVAAIFKQSVDWQQKKSGVLPQHLREEAVKERHKIRQQGDRLTLQDRKRNECHCGRLKD